MVTNQRLVVEVVDARNLLPKDGHGTSSPYVVINFHGQKKRTQTTIRDLNPIWSEVLEFNVGASPDVFGDILEIDLYHDKACGPTRRTNFLGRVRLNSGQFVKKGEEALIYYPLEKKSLISWVQGEIGLKIYYVDEVPLPPPSPLPPQPPVEEIKSDAAAPAAVEGVPVSDSQPKAEDEADAVKSNAQAAPLVEPPSDIQPPLAEAVQAMEPAPLPPANTPPENEKPPESDPPAQEESTNQVEQPPPSMQSNNPENDVTFKWIPSPEMMEGNLTRSTSEIKFAGMNGPRPISRTLTGGMFPSELPETIPIERSSYDLVQKMHYLFVRVVKARSLPTNRSPIVKIGVSNCQVCSKLARKTTFFEWEQTFAFGRDSTDSSSILEVSVWDPPISKAEDPLSDVAGRNFLGGICFDVTEIPLRDPPDSPLAPQWYRLEGGGANNGDLMLATWIGTQADESFPDAWKTDTAGNVNAKAKVYLSPKLWYLRATVIEAQDLTPLMASRDSPFQVKVQLGFQVLKTKPSVTPNGTPSWNEDMLFVAAEPFSDHLIFSLENRQPKATVTLGVLKVPLTAIERRVDDRKVVSRWFSFEDHENEKRLYKGRVHLRICFDGGYHVMDEAAHVCSDFRPTARQLWRPPVGTVELGIIGCKNLLPMKTVNRKGSTDSYAVAKYGPKWVRTRTVCDSLDPRWNEQYTWNVYDPCTVLTVGVFDSMGVVEIDASKDATRPDLRMGKVRIRISTLETGRVYKNTYPLLLLSNTGMKKMGEIELAVRFVRATSTLDLLHVYSQPSLPLMHHIRPLGVAQQDALRNTAAKILAVHLSRSEPPLKREVVLCMLDADSHAFSMRKVRANWFRIINVIAGVIDIVRWVENTREWKNPTATILVHALLVMLVWFPDLIIPTLAFYVFVIGVWNYRFKSRVPLPHLDPKISLADAADRDELDEEFDTLPSSRSMDVMRVRYDKLRMIGARVQNVLGDLATQGERVQALVTWRDPRATGIFVGLCFLVAVILYLVPSKMVAMAFGFYYLRHPLFRDRMPSPAVNFFRRLPSLSDRIM